MGRTSDARERLIESAIALFWRHGFAGVSVDQLCESAGVKKGSFYHFFASKEELALAALEAHWERRKPILDELFSPSRAPLERLAAYFRFIHTRQCEIQGTYGQVLGCFYFSLGTSNVDQPRLNQRVREIIGFYERYHQSALVEAEQQGLVKLRDPAEKARDLFRYIEGLLADARLHGTTDRLADMPRLGFEFIGLEAPEPPDAAKLPTVATARP
ncbi:MAG TPA: TetR/AcrR family transcriptional regulator [Polyangiaceae bacterium]|nr:TetR/AcrR family transcriptional regulator [Polyangiaceae bacterium]